MFAFAAVAREIDIQRYPAKQPVQRRFLLMHRLDPACPQRESDFGQESVARAKIAVVSREREIVQRHQREHDRQDAHDHERGDDHDQGQHDLHRRSEPRQSASAEDSNQLYTASRFNLKKPVS